MNAKDLDTKLTHDDMKVRLRSLRAAVAGNILEWFDWTLYATLSVYIAANFFDEGDSASALLSTLAVFAVGFLARPIGGIIFGKLGDRLGRKTTLVITMVTMAVGSLIMAVLPSYETIGVWASALLLMSRLLQGLAHGGESGVSYTYVAELAPAKRRGLWSSSIFVSVTLGVMGATFVAVILTAVFSGEQMNAFGWRLGFGLGALLGVYALYLRMAAVESPVFEENEDSQDSAQAVSSSPSDANEKMSPRQMALITAKIIMLCGASNVVYYVWVTFGPAFAISAHNMDPNAAFVASLLAQVVVLILLPVFGHLSDRFGRKPMVLAFGVLVIVVVFPVNAIISEEPWTLFVALALGLTVWGTYASIYPAVMAEQIPTKHRAFGISFLTSLSVAVFGGTAPFLNEWLASIGLQWIFSLWVIFLGLLTIVASFMIRETAGVPLNSITAESGAR